MFIINFARKITALFIALIMSIGVTCNGAPAHTVLDEDECRLCIAVISDCHIEGNNLPRYNVLGTILKDAKNNTFGNDAAVFLGDNTMNGQDIESLLFYGLLKKSNITDNHIIVCGNHDVGNGNGDYKQLCDRFLSYNNGVLGMDIEKPYYYKVINGYYFITIAPEALCVSELPMTEEQYEFLDETLALATAEGKPAFVCAHHPWDYAERYDPATGESDWRDNTMYEILTKYDNVFYLAGHTHMPCFEGWTFDEYDGINEVNLPRCTELGGENDRTVGDYTGYTVQLEVYDGEVVGRVRNSYTGVWDDELEYHFELVK